MASYDIFFFGALYFLLGVLLVSFGLEVFTILLITILVFVVFLLSFYIFSGKQGSRKLIWLAGLSFFIIFGSFYYQWDHSRFENSQIIFDQKIIFQGIVVSNPEIRNTNQQLIVQLTTPLEGKILVRLSPYPSFQYGDKIKFEGVIKKPNPKGYANYLAKDRISGVSYFPEPNLQISHQGSLIKEKLFQLKGRMLQSFQRVLPIQEAAFLSGLTLGIRGEFDTDFKEAMNRSGTTHLVALSGYNISIIAWAVAGLLGYIFSKRFSFFATLLIIVGFVLMTGGEASVIRAAIMGILALLARQIGQIYDIRNAVVFAALLMILFNPKVLFFDVGFQLSFLALLGIVYLRPAIIRLFRMSESPGFLSWRDNLLTTTSAQLAVAPMLIASFGNFSLTSLLANVIILEIVPVTMFFGFLIAVVSFFSYYFSLILGWIAWLLLHFEIMIINFFAKFSILLQPTLSWILIIIYYLIIVGVVIYSKDREA